MGIIYSQNKFETNQEADTLCFNMDTLENDILTLFYKIISKIEILFNVKLNLKRFDKDNTKNIHTHFEIDNCLLEIKLIKEEKIFSLGYTKTRLKLFTQKNDSVHKEKFYKLCSYL